MINKLSISPYLWILWKLSSLPIETDWLYTFIRDNKFENLMKIFNAINW